MREESVNIELSVSTDSVKKIQLFEARKRSILILNANSAIFICTCLSIAIRPRCYFHPFIVYREEKYLQYNEIFIR